MVGIYSMALEVSTNIMVGIYSMHIEVATNAVDECNHCQMGMGGPVNENVCLVGKGELNV